MGSSPAAKPQPEQVNAAESQTPITSSQIKQALWVAFCGALGGVIFWSSATGPAPQRLAIGNGTVKSWPGFSGRNCGLFGVFLLTAPT